MPDSTWSTVSASQSAALFGKSPYCTKFTLWHAFRTRDRALLEVADNNRMRAGRLLQHFILAETADRFRLEVVPNFEDKYETRGQLGCTVDGHLIAPDQGEIVVEAKNVDWLIYRDQWSETAAPEHIEIQLQQQLFVRGVPRGIIAAWVGGNEYVAHEREANPEIHAALEREAALFFESLAAGKEPDPLGSPLELPGLVRLYPATDPIEVLEQMDDVELGETIRQFAWAREQESFAKRLKEQLQAKILARAKTAGIVRAPGVRAFINKSPIAESRQTPPPDLALAVSALLTATDTDALERCVAAIRECWPDCWPVTRKASIQTRIKVEEVEGDEKPANGAWAA